MENILHTAREQKAFAAFVKDYQLTSQQEEQFLTFLDLFLSTNEDFNLTAITDVVKVIDFHFRDSLELGRALDLSSVKGLADIGSGGGFPGIPLKIMYPELFIVLIEVKRKKINFLWDVVNKLDLENVFVSELDWRTFLRKADFDLDIFCARASLHTDELFRLFKPSCSYKNSSLVYWASNKWEPTSEDLSFMQREVSYEVGNKQRKLVFFTRSPQEAAQKS